MMNKLTSFQIWLKKSVWQGWRWLLKYGKKPWLLGRKAMRRSFCGRIGFRTEYVLHVTNTNLHSDIDEKVKELLQQSEKKFREGQFFEPIADQVDQGFGIVTGRLKQGQDEAQSDHLVAIYPIEKW